MLALCPISSGSSTRAGAALGEAVVPAWGGVVVHAAAAHSAALRATAGRVTRIARLTVLPNSRLCSKPYL
ncbi:hypothetical protein Pth03_57600 [Planotetraspora thailandica]|uniref:Uncharacterized protein n=1 Tax=Planotetraspora thailandica TaxID=487172 RepID=A0A8J3V5M8_9ACTN|nr:hypothetical protein Pth03_57600 [Planotetraspora thailandica]